MNPINGSFLRFDIATTLLPGDCLSSPGGSPPRFFPTVKRQCQYQKKGRVKTRPL
jgi:hypothetical protein